MKKIRKAIFPVGGLGTRFLPATKSMPKEMLPVVDKPLIHYAFEEAQAAGIEQFIFITGRNKNSISNHFDHSYELQRTLSDQSKERELRLTQAWLPEPGTMMFIRQQQPLGLGHAVWCARHLIGDEPFAVLLADDLILGKTPCLKQMVDAYESGNMVAALNVSAEETRLYGTIDIESEKGDLINARALVEKPGPEHAPSTVCVTGRYILEPEIFDYLDKKHTGSGGEIQLTDAINARIGVSSVTGFRFEGTRYDCGSLIGFIEANIAYALSRADLKEDVLGMLKKFSKL